MLTRIWALWQVSPFQRPSRSNPAKNLTCTEFEADNWAVSRFELGKLVPVVATRPFPPSELMLMCAATCRLMPRRVFGWGTNVGKSACVFYVCAKHDAIYWSAGSAYNVRPHAAMKALLRAYPGRYRTLRSSPGPLA